MTNNLQTHAFINGYLEKEAKLDMSDSFVKNLVTNGTVAGRVQAQYDRQGEEAPLAVRSPWMHQLLATLRGGGLGALAGAGLGGAAGYVGTRNLPEDAPEGMAEAGVVGSSAAGGYIGGTLGATLALILARSNGVRDAEKSLQSTKGYKYDTEALEGEELEEALRLVKKEGTISSRIAGAAQGLFNPQGWAHDRARLKSLKGEEVNALSEIGMPLLSAPTFGIAPLALGSLNKSHLNDLVADRKEDRKLDRFAEKIRAQ